MGQSSQEEEDDFEYGHKIEGDGGGKRGKCLCESINAKHHQ